MKYLHLFFASLLIAFTTGCDSGSTDPSPELKGVWQGYAKGGVARIDSVCFQTEIVISAADTSVEGEGIAEAAFTDRFTSGVIYGPEVSGTYSGSQLTLAIDDDRDEETDLRSVRARFEGEVAADGESISGEIEVAKGNFNDNGEPFYDYHDPISFTLQRVAEENGIESRRCTYTSPGR